MKKSSINENWRFYKEGEENNVKPVTLPHDAMIHEKRDPVSKSGSAGAFFPGGKYIYEKTLEMQDTSICGKVLLHFDGVYRNASVYVNGQKAGELLFDRKIDISPYTCCGNNDIKVEFTIGNRNFLGPFHLDGVEGFIGPGSFEECTLPKGEDGHYRYKLHRFYSGCY